MTRKERENYICSIHARHGLLGLEAPHIGWLIAEIRRLDAENDRLLAVNMRLMEENGRLRFEAKYGTNEPEAS